MSCNPIWTVWCNADPGTASNCFHWCQMTGMSAALARQNARDLGWKRIGSKDICPACQRGGRTVAHGASR